ncbi:class I SAM-dependent methyltransferase [Chitinophaga rhizophila]|uniref:S-adenosyl-L-methionine-dependent methyltransferase n=1 Tax=Chitinophaga rhizophila TaxID=2866212 RepID=A0ABS7GBT6_9BACT|nr:SAM-dependent methyltransferase [Chitinophaga rhizophila]MBW8685135.1 SAM-dependent methyltransferase [Chitinophaga rhizophila]
MSLVPASKATTYLALLRAIESNRPASKRLLYDPYAKLFLSSSFRLVELLSRISFLNTFIAWFIDKNWTGALTCCAARTRLVDVMTVNTVEDEGINQVIVFGAGYDCRSLRLDMKKRVQFVEVDHPAFQAGKRHVLSRSSFSSGRETMTNYITADLNTQDLDQVLPQLFQKGHYKTMFIWEGVTNSIADPIAPRVFDYFKRFRPGTIIIFTYVDKAVLEHPEKFAGAVAITRLLKSNNEYWNFGIDPANIKQFLASYNMELMYNLDTGKYRKLYYGEDAADMKGYEFYRVAMARVIEH